MQLEGQLVGKRGTSHVIGFVFGPDWPGRQHLYTDWLGLLAPVCSETNH